MRRPERDRIVQNTLVRRAVRRLQTALEVSSSSGRALSRLWVAGIAFGVSACSGPQGGTTESSFNTTAVVDRSAPVQEGEFVTYVSDFADGHSERTHALRLGDGTELPLAFDDAPTTSTGTHVRVHGAPAGAGFHVQSVEEVADLAPVQEAPAATPPTIAAPAQDTYALVLVDISGTDAGVNVSMAQGQTAMFSTNPTDKSFASFYYESSYGKYTITGDVIGPYSFPMTTCDTTGMFEAIEPQITGTYNHLIYYFNETPLCTFGGLGEEGSVTKPAKRTWMNGSLSCVVLMQEPGHNLGLMHGNTITCGTSSFSTTPATSCTITEYGNTMTPMGSGCHQLNGYEKWYEQWLAGCNGVRVTSTGTFNLVPLGDSCPGAVQVLQVPMPATLTVSDPQATTTAVNLKDYYVELRAAAGVFDQYNTGRATRGIAYTGPTVTIYTSDDVHTGTAARGTTGNSVWTELLNMNPTSTTFAGLTTAGQSFTDPAGGATITLQSISATGAVIGVTVPNGTGDPTCIDGTTLVGTGSDCDGGAVIIPPFDAGVVAKDAGATAAKDAGAPDGAVARDGGGGGSSDGGRLADGAAANEDGATGAASHDAGVAANGDGGTTLGGNSGNNEGNSAPSNNSSGCACQSVGAAGGGVHDTWAGIGALALIGWGAKRRRASEAARLDASKRA